MRKIQGESEPDAGSATGGKTQQSSVSKGVCGNGALSVNGVAQAAEEALGPGYCIWTLPHLFPYQYLQTGQYCFSSLSFPPSLPHFSVSQGPALQKHLMSNMVLITAGSTPIV